jgi:hypothetical protein
MSLEIDQSIEIPVRPEVVWNVITDLARYPDWNPFVVACDSTLVVGEPIAMRVRLIASFTQSQTETVFEHEPGHRLSYGLSAVPLGALRSLRSHLVVPAGTDHARYESHFELSGWLAPLVRALVGAPLERGFKAMTEAIAARAEQLGDARQSDRTTD